MTDNPVNLLNSTEQFMRLARQLDGQPVMDMMFDDHGVLSDHLEAKNIRRLRKKMLREEVREYFDAEDDDDIVEIVDGLLDIIVIAWGTLLAYVGPDRANRSELEVAYSNLSKVMGSYYTDDGEKLPLPIFRADGKVLKPPNWIAPDIKGALGLKGLA